MKPAKSLPMILLLLILAGFDSADAAKLPAYEAAEKKEFIWVCDAETTRIQTDLYRAADYYVSLSSTKTGAAFMGVYYSTEGRAQFLVKLTGSPDFVELPREEWQEKIKADMSPNYYKRIRNMENDCSCVSGCN